MNWNRTSAMTAGSFSVLLVLLVSCRSSLPPDAPLGGASRSPDQPAVGAEGTATSEDVATVVDHLLRRIAESGLTFIRNGKEHTASEAADHIRDKYEYYKDEIKTPEDFIAKSATSSALTGKPYLVRTGDGKTPRVADWLRESLAEYRAQSQQIR